MAGQPLILCLFWMPLICNQILLDSNQLVVEHKRTDTAATVRRLPHTCDHFSLALMMLCSQSHVLQMRFSQPCTVMSLHINALGPQTCYDTTEVVTLRVAKQGSFAAFSQEKVWYLQV